MAIADMPQSSPRPSRGVPYEKSDSAFDRVLLGCLDALSSLKLTVVLMALGVFLVFAGTLAQAEQGIWDVVHTYFRSWGVAIKLQVFFPHAFFPSHPVVSGWFPFPGGLTIGTLMCVNLLAAHLRRFQVQVKGQRLLAGLGAIAVGVAVTVFVILSGSNKNGMLELPWISWPVLWYTLETLTLIGSIVGVVAAFRAAGQSRAEQWARRVVLYGSAILAGLLMLGILGLFKVEFYPGDAAMRIVWQLTKGAIAGFILLAGCAVLFRKRAGVVLLHAGVGLIMLNEVVVGLFHVETQMTVAQGQTVNWAQDIRTTELAIIDTSDPKLDDVTVIPSKLLERRGGQVISDDHLPFDVKLVEFLPNSDLRARAKGEKTPATAGLGLDIAAEPRRIGAGADTDTGVDMPSAYVELFKRGTKESLGTYLVGVPLTLRDIPESVDVGGKSYDLYLRFARYYKPYSVHVNRVVQENYPGTSRPKSYESYVHVVDPARNFDRDNIKIWMNNPLRFGDETFYQSGMQADPRSPVKTTTFQVVSNTGWMIPYVACAIVAIGMGAHFLITLARFLGRQLETDKSTSAGRWGVVVPLAAAVLLAGYYGSRTRTPTAAPDTPDIAAFGRLPVFYDGRLVPMDALARNILHQLSDYESYVPYSPQLDEPKTLWKKWFGPRVKRQPGVQWLLELASRTEVVRDHRVFRIQNLEVLDALGLKPREGYHYSPAEVVSRLEAFRDQAKLVSKVPSKERDIYQAKLMAAWHKFMLYSVVHDSFTPLVVPEFPTAEELQQNPEAAKQKLMDSMARTREAIEHLNASEPVMAVPVKDEAGKWNWIPYANAAIEAYVKRQIGQPVDKGVTMMSQMLFHYGEYCEGPAEDRAKNAAEFNKAVKEYDKYVHEALPASVGMKGVDVEAFYNVVQPLTCSKYGYLMSFAVLAIGWMGWTRVLNRTAFAMLAVTVALNVIAIVMRIYISGRPPVTNLYSSALFIGCGAAIFGLALEAIFRIGMGNLVAAFSGAVCLFVADALANGDTMGVPQAVLDTNFWLATHVVCIATGYFTTYIAWFLAVIMLIVGAIRALVERGNRSFKFFEIAIRALDRMVYGILCFAILFSFVGTVLGGLWADDSWGRFWGWDPKENGALIIVLWNALVLHARWDKQVGPRGTAILAVFGGCVTSWSWYGVNELGAGLHSYGFTEGVLLALIVFCASQWGIMALGWLLPKSLFRTTAPEKPIKAQLV
ncbi:MAG: cytochrome c biogenesis protein CcsA [Planctomycetes bacterium]|nr:cytochrome c biogenesis protein CcsA [Planctomycetota bacterium]